MELREQIAEIVAVCNGWHMGEDYPLKAADQILSLLPKPTVTIPCETCGGETDRRFCQVSIICPADLAYPDHSGICRSLSCSDARPCTCTDGKVEREIEWLSDYSIDGDADIDGEANYKTLTLTDLLDPDVAMAYSWLSIEHEVLKRDSEIPNNKGVLRVKC